MKVNGPKNIAKGLTWQMCYFKENCLIFFCSKFCILHIVVKWIAIIANFFEKWPKIYSISFLQINIRNFRKFANNPIGFLEGFNNFANIPIRFWVYCTALLLRIILISYYIDYFGVMDRVTAKKRQFLTLNNMVLKFFQIRTFRIS